MLTLYNVISSDGFIAREDGSEDFIPDDTWLYFLNLCEKYGAVIMGRKTYETIQKYDKKLLAPFEYLPIQKIIVTGNTKFHPKEGYIAVHSPEDAVLRSPNALVSSGPTLNNYLLKNHFVVSIILNEIPVAIQKGLRPFDQKDFNLTPAEVSLKDNRENIKEYIVS